MCNEPKRHPTGGVTEIMFPSLRNLSLNAPSRRGPVCRPCVPFGDPYTQPPDYTLPGMEQPDPERDDINRCTICNEPLSGPAGGREQVEGEPDVMALERVRASNAQYHRICLAGWVLSGKETCPNTRKRIHLEEIKGLLVFLGYKEDHLDHKDDEDDDYDDAERERVRERVQEQFETYCEGVRIRCFELSMVLGDFSEDIFNDGNTDIIKDDIIRRIRLHALEVLSYTFMAEANYHTNGNIFPGDSEWAGIEGGMYEPTFIDMEWEFAIGNVYIFYNRINDIVVHATSWVPRRDGIQSYLRRLTGVFLALFRAMLTDRVSDTDLTPDLLQSKWTTLLEPSGKLTLVGYEMTRRGGLQWLTIRDRGSDNDEAPHPTDYFTEFDEFDEFEPFDLLTILMMFVEIDEFKTSHREFHSSMDPTAQQIVKHSLSRVIWSLKNSVNFLLVTRHCCPWNVRNNVAQAVKAARGLLSVMEGYDLQLPPTVP